MLFDAGCLTLRHSWMTDALFWITGRLLLVRGHSLPRSCLLVLLSCLAIARPAFSLDGTEEISPGVRVTIAGDTAIIRTNGFEFSFPPGWKLDAHPAGFISASISKDMTPMVAITSCSIASPPNGDCSTTGRAASELRARFLTSVQKGMGPAAQVKRNDNVEEYVRSGKDVLNRVPVRQIEKLFISSADVVMVLYVSPADSDAGIESELASLLNGKLVLR